MNRTLLALSVSLGLISGGARAQEYTFDPAMLGSSAKDLDMSLFNEGGQLPGTYTVDIILNGDKVDSRDVVFSLGDTASGGKDLNACLSVEQLSRYGVLVDKYPGLSAGGGCAKLSAIPDAKTNFQFNNQQLLLSIPQVSLRVKQSGIAPQELWDDGIAAFLMDYRANINRVEHRGGDNGNTQSAYVQLNPGINLGPWRLRNQTNWQKQGNDGGRWQNVFTYVERGLNKLKSRVTLGDRSTPGDVFDSLPFRGAMLGTDDNMVPYNQREYAPVIRGIARTQARVEVKQRGYTIYNQTVAPGPFALQDLNVSGVGGDLQVTVWETDGNPQVFTVPYQTPAISLHEGYLKYNVMAGRYRPANSGTSDSVGQVTAMYGLPWNLTVYGGAQAAKHYQAVSAGVGISLGVWGAISLDGTRSHARRQGMDTENGTAWRARYSKDIVATNTTLTMTSYQYASSGFSTLSDTLDSWMDKDNNNRIYASNPNNSPKSTMSLILNQSMGRWGYASLYGRRSDYWDHSEHDDSYGASYGVGINGISMTFSLSRNTQYNSNSDPRMDTLTSIYFSVPLDRWLKTGEASMNATYQLTTAKGAATNQVGLNGWAFDRQLNWDVQQNGKSGDDVSDRNNSAMHMAWYGRYGQAGGNYSYSPDQRQMGADVSGSMVIHRNGITLGQTLGNSTAALIEAPGAAGIPVSGTPGISTDFRGYTTKTSLSPYQENTISLDPTRLPSNAEITQTDMRVVPTQGAIVPAKFATRIGARALMTLIRPGGLKIPFGTVVTLDQVGGAGIVADNGLVYLTGLPPRGTLVVNLNKQSQCRVNYTLPENDKEKNAAGLYTLTGVCQ